MENIIKYSIKRADKMLSQFYLSFFSEKNSLITFLFHGLFQSEKEISLNLKHPLEGITIEHFCLFVEYYLNHDYIFISPEDILNGLRNDKKYILITFDDGYFNNQHALPILKKYKIPAVFFISANHVKYNKSFWWDILYRESIKRGLLIKHIMHEEEKLKSKTNEDIEDYLKNRFGEGVSKPISDIDRPFTPSELKDFSKEKYVFIGNHTCDHAILTNYFSNDIESQIRKAQNIINDITGVSPNIISYPNGNYSKEIISISKGVGLKLGITVDLKKNHLPIDFRGNNPMRLGRFVLVGNERLINQCEMIRSDIAVCNTIKNLLKGGIRS
jgi:peptidoglycan/xylan/chitin deacetylase (PgdA/CDA1 family)